MNIKFLKVRWILAKEIKKNRFATVTGGLVRAYSGGVQ
ncbi:hypothetical protein SC1083_1529 [Aggregatibacter actinomycetemcomitans serotype e str. SC1083]|uniref:Uncharacterized protein n=1 Tax=Aggregatibacter actinomycetemcomitans serotype e str. SC1083 TaxID=907488 RepID=G4A9L3_AGGAC|nr:hypothetical protein SC1083_1529 [Aggregatibacter actinomycetemcomitans serotype e str. SC1083]